MRRSKSIILTTLYRPSDGAQAIVEAGTETEERLRSLGFGDTRPMGATIQPESGEDVEKPAPVRRRRGRPRKAPATRLQAE